MLPFKRILFPVDFSAQAVGAARYAEAFAGRFDADITLLHVIDLPHYNDLTPDSPAQKRARLKSFLATELEYFRVQRITAEGDPSANILRIAREQKSDLIMMPTHGHGPFRRFLIGSVTAKVLHDADCPVWTGVHLESAPPLEKIELHRVLCAVNLDPHCAKVLAGATELASEYRAELTVLHVPTARDSTAEAREFISKISSGAEIVVEAGEVPDVVAKVAGRVRADLVVIGRSPSPGVFGRLRTHAYPIIRQTPCPVISV
jgi:nucleotide-binding universal stress UspA family protein